jgi:hypothetical protein
VHHERISVVGALAPDSGFSFMDLKAILENYQVAALPASHRVGCNAARLEQSYCSRRRVSCLAQDQPP